MFCDQCGAAAQPGDSWCSTCGTSLAVAGQSAAPPSAPAAVTPLVHPATAGPRSRSRGVRLGLVCAVVLLLGGGGYVSYLSVHRIHRLVTNAGQATTPVSPVSPPVESVTTPQTTLASPAPISPSVVQTPHQSPGGELPRPSEGARPPTRQSANVPVTPPQGSSPLADLFRTPQKTKDVKPVYPETAASAGVQGIVVVEATIGSDGKVQSASVVKSIPLLDEAALDAVRQWEFTPTVINGVRVPVKMTFRVSVTPR